MFPSTTTVAALLSLAAFASAHCTVVDVYDANNKVLGHGWGVNTHGKFPHDKTGAGDPGADSTRFATGDSPNPPCGAVASGNLDPDTEIANSEANGVPYAYNNGSVVFKVFQVDADGGGPMSCEYSKGQLNDFQPMVMTLNMAGNFGTLQHNDRVNSTVVATFPNGASCNAGSKKDTCVVRCRAGVNHGFGSCFSVKLPVKTFYSKVAHHASVNPGQGNNKRDLDLEERYWDEDVEAIELETRDLFERSQKECSIPKSQLQSMAAKIVKKMKQAGVAVKAQTKRDIAEQIVGGVENNMS